MPLTTLEPTWPCTRMQRTKISPTSVFVWKNSHNAVLEIYDTLLSSSDNPVGWQLELDLLDCSLSSPFNSLILEVK